MSNIIKYFENSFQNEKYYEYHIILLHSILECRESYTVFILVPYVFFVDSSGSKEKSSNNSSKPPSKKDKTSEPQPAQKDSKKQGGVVRSNNKNK